MGAPKRVIFMRQNVTLPLEMGEGFAGWMGKESCTGSKLPVAPDRDAIRRWVLMEDGVGNG